MGPTINPSPKNVSRVAKDVPTLCGNSAAMIVNEAVKNAEFPSASIILIINARVINAVRPGTRSSIPKRIAEVPVIKTPPLKTA